MHEEIEIIESGFDAMYVMPINMDGSTIQMGA